VKLPAYFQASARTRSRPQRGRSIGDGGYSPTSIFENLTGRENSKKARVCTTLPCLPVLFDQVFHPCKKYFMNLLCKEGASAHPMAKAMAGYLDGGE